MPVEEADPVFSGIADSVLGMFGYGDGSHGRILYGETFDWEKFNKKITKIDIKKMLLW